eukprot:TRINITY_DN16540_c0_g1_i1.p1 TRINITY_DN16540_c0_g1~~TRINITY_DN16540_c0_g1_i1.p1  ORF type:complete len:555 (-),score=118.65 TRINITY_DN16540_c0_g1_i1:91-1755(-)
MATSKADAKDKARAKKDEKKEVKGDKKRSKTSDSKKGEGRSVKSKAESKSKVPEKRAAAEEEARERKAAAAAAATATKKRKVEDQDEDTAETKKSKKSAKSSKESQEEATERRRNPGGAADGVVIAPSTLSVTSERQIPAETQLQRKALNRGVCAAEALDGKDDIEADSKIQAGGSTSSRAPATSSTASFVNKTEQKVEKVDKVDKLDKEQRSRHGDEKRQSDRDRDRDQTKGRRREPLDDSASDYGADDASESGTSASARRLRRREEAGLKPASGFGLAPPPPPPGNDAAQGPVMYGPSSLVPLPDKVKGLLEHQDNLALEVQKMKMSLSLQAPAGPPEPKEEVAETTLKMPTRLSECLLAPENHPKLLTRTGLLSAHLNEEKHVVLRAPSRKQLTKVLGQLRRVAWVCQWGCSVAKVGALLAEKPAKPVNSMVIRLAPTSSRLQSHDARLNAKMKKLRIGTQAGPGMLVLDGISGLSRKHCTITFEPEKSACYVQDLSTNGTYLNGKRLPRPPYKNPTDARVRLFHGDELMFKLRTDDAEELGYVVNLLELN